MAQFWEVGPQKQLWKGLQECMDSELAEEFLQTLLTIMVFMFAINSDYRKNIKNFKGRYQFNSVNGQITVAAIFENGYMRVYEKTIPDPHITVTFRNGRALLNFLFSPEQDILGAMLRHDVQTNGNLNYLYRFGFLAKQLQLMMPEP